MCENVALEAGPLAGLQKLVEAYCFNAAIRSQYDLRCHLRRAAGYNCL